MANCNGVRESLILSTIVQIEPPEQTQTIPCSHTQSSSDQTDSSHSSSTEMSNKSKKGFIFFSVLIIALFTVKCFLFAARWIVQETMCHNASSWQISINFSTEGENVGLKFNHALLFDIVQISIKILHIPEHISLLINLYNFLVSKNRYKKFNFSKFKMFVQRKETCLRCCLNSAENCCQESADKEVHCRCRLPIFISVPIIFMLVAIATPSVHIWQTMNNSSEIFEQCSYNIAVTTLVLLYAMNGILFITNVIIVLDCFLMILFTIIIGVIWRIENRSRDHDPSMNGACIVNNSAVNAPETNQSEPANEVGEQNHPKHSAHHDRVVKLLSAADENLVTVCNKYSEHMTEFENKVKLVRPIYKIFQSFFVLQWIIHLFGLFFHISHLFHPWIRDNQTINSKTLPDIIHHVLFVLFDGLAIGITYICALKMNAYLRRYVRDLQRKQLEAVEGNAVQYSLTHLFHIKPESILKSNFTPRIPGTGFSISINNPSFMLSIVISVSAILVSQIAF